MSAIAVSFRALRLSTAVQVIAGVLLIDAILVGSLIAVDAPTRTVAMVGIAGLLVPCVLYLAVFIRPVYLISAAAFLTMWSGNWRAVGFPSMVSPDRLFFIVGIGAFLLRDPARGERRPLRFSYVYVLIGLAAAYTVASAIGAHTLFNKSDLWPLVDRFGLVPFALFIVAPAVYATERDRRILLVTLVAMAAYLALIATAQGIGAHALIWPRYILHHNNHQIGRARGPFNDSATNGLALYYMAIACVLAFWTFRRSRWRWLIAAIGFTCLFDVLFTQQRSVFIGTTVGTILIMLVVPRFRKFLPVVLIGGALIVGAAFLASNSLRQELSQRVSQQTTVWDRYNLDGAAERMFLAKPLTGFGWGQYLTQSINYFRQAASYPITAVGEPDHSVVLSNLAELGLIGTGLWALALAFGVGGAIVRRGPPQLYGWRIALIGVFVMWLTVANLNPLVASFPNQILWLLAGVAWPIRYGVKEMVARRAPAVPAVAAAPVPAAAGVGAGSHGTARRRPAPARQRDAAHSGRRIRTGLRITPLLLGAAVLAALGFLSGQSTAGTSVSVSNQASAGPVEVTYPSTWHRAQEGSTSVPGLSDTVTLAPYSPAGSALVIGRSTSPDSNLLPSALAATLPSVPAPKIVTLGALRMYRYRDLAPRSGAPIVSLYVLPTTSGTIVSACVASTSETGLLPECEQLLATMKLTSDVVALPLTPSRRYADGLSTVIRKLNATSSRAAAQLRTAHDPGTQVKAAEALSAADKSAATALSQLQSGQALAANQAMAKALDEASAAYGSLAGAASRNDGHAYRAARTAVMHAGQDVRSAFAQLAQFGYHVG